VCVQEVGEAHLGDDRARRRSGWNGSKRRGCFCFKGSRVADKREEFVIETKATHHEGGKRLPAPPPRSPLLLASSAGQQAQPNGGGQWPHDGGDVRDIYISEKQFYKNEFLY
jgi:hypothetical protein